ncbi:Transposable element P transposase [Frankliniella fusca]|uniref:Transposable element P transposase n=1 Tax=Frankliniella fusca TaxID=407009 RepID=A0AAE1HF38_9NEOP|nr:Transposable element P transposase [Frankliniella fusca]
MHRFPLDPKRRTEWLQNIGRPDWEPTLHFSDTAYSAGRHRLLPDAVPFPIRSSPPEIICSCAPVQNKSVLVYSEHSYASLSSEFCQVHRQLAKSKTVSEDYSKNCHLLKAINHLEDVKTAKKLQKPKKVHKFTSADIRRGLQLWLGCGTSGYAFLRNLMKREFGIDLPARRTLQESTEHLKFAPGILEEVMVPLKAKFQGFTDERDKDVNIVFDEFHHKRQVDYDPSTKHLIGYGTLPGQEHLHAQKTEIYLFRSVHQRMKQIVAYNQNPSEECASESKKEFIVALLRKAFEVGANVISLVCDMGNRGLLKQLGFSTTRNNMKWCIANPVTGSRLWCMPDPYGLPSRYVKVDHIEWLEAFQRDDTLQLVPGLTFKDTCTGHFSKMNVRGAAKIFNPRCAAALKYLVVAGLFPEELETTSFFLLLMNRWFQLMCSRNLQFAFGHKDKNAYSDAIKHLELVIYVFENCIIPGGWKPVQTHIIFATRSMLEIQKHLLEERKYKFVQTSGFAADCAENVNSQVRMSCPNPTPLEVKSKIKYITISQFQAETKSSSYNFDGCPDYVDLLLKPGESTVPSFDVNNTVEWSSIKWCDTVPVSKTRHQEDILNRLCGYVIKSLQKRKMLKCESCVSKLKHCDPTPHPNSIFLMLTNFVPGTLFPVIDELFQMFRLIEHNLRLWLPHLRHLENLDVLVDKFIQPGTAHIQLPTCHNVKEKLVKAFSLMRFRQLAVTVLSPVERTSAAALSSKTTGGHFLTQNFGSPAAAPSQQKTHRAAATPGTPSLNTRRTHSGPPPLSPLTPVQSVPPPPPLTPLTSHQMLQPALPPPLSALKAGPPPPPLTPLTLQRKQKVFLKRLVRFP